MPDDEDRPRDANGAADLAVVIPDDLRELAADVAAYHREVRVARRRERRHRLFNRPVVLPLVIVTAAVILAAVVAMLLTAFAPTTETTDQAAQPLAHPTTAAGQVNGLLPAVALRDARQVSVPATGLRPGVVALVPAGCRCAGKLATLAGQVNEVGDILYLVVPTTPAADPEAASFTNQVSSHGRAQVLYDDRGRLASALHATGITVVLVQADGTIDAVLRSLTPGDHMLDAQLQEMTDVTRVTG